MGLLRFELRSQGPEPWMLPGYTTAPWIKKMLSAYKMFLVAEELTNSKKIKKYAIIF